MPRNRAMIANSLRVTGAGCAEDAIKKTIIALQGHVSPYARRLAQISMQATASPRNDAFDALSQ